LKRGRIVFAGATAGALVVVIVAVVLVSAALGSGPDRAALARQTTTEYWSDIGHGKMLAAYHLLTSGTAQARPFTQYSQDMYGFVAGVAFIWATTGATEVQGDHAIVRVHLHSPKTTRTLDAYQHLFWENGGWRISDLNGGVSQQK
jgi:hypothetical protein